MNGAEQKLHKHYKLEADDIMFADLQFDERMKERVMRSIQSASKPSFQGKRLASWRKSLIFAALTAAAIIVVFIDLPSIQSPPSDQPPVIMTTLDAPIEAEQLKTLTPESLEDAQRMFGEELHLPAYMPEAYTLQNEIVAYGTAEGTADKVVFSYSSGVRSYLFIIEKEASLEPYANFEKIDFDGIKGYIDSVNETNTGLYWIDNDRLYSIIGELTRDEAVKVAQSIKR